MMDCIAILGPTASGKSSLAMRIARESDGEIVSADSRQAYRGLDIGTSKPTSEERRLVTHHMIDILDPREKNSAASYARAARDTIVDIRARGALPLLVGGSGLYLRAIFDGLFDVELDDEQRKRFELSVRARSTEEIRARLVEVDPASAERIHANDRYRIVRALEVFELTGTPLSEHFERPPRRSAAELRFTKIGIDLPREVLHDRINERTRVMIDSGWVEETERLIERGVDQGSPGMRTLGYPQIISFIRGEIDREGLIERIQALTRQYAKRQMTWFRKEPDVQWISGDLEELCARALSILSDVT